MVDLLDIREALEKDAGNIYKIHTAAIRKKCSSHYSTEDVNVWVERQDKEKYLPFIVKREMIVAEVEGRVVGFGHLTGDTLTSSVESKGKALQIKGLFVDPDCGVKGVGTALEKELEKRALEGGAKVLTVHSSLNAVEFYKKCGFVELEATTHQMSEQSCLQCLRMVKTL